MRVRGLRSIDGVVLLTVGMVVLAGVLSAAAALWHSRSLSSSYDAAIKAELEEKARAYGATTSAFLDALGPGALPVIRNVLLSVPDEAAGADGSDGSQLKNEFLSFELWLPDPESNTGYDLLASQDFREGDAPRGSEEARLRLLDEAGASQDAAVAVDEEAQLIQLAVPVDIDEETRGIVLGTLSAEPEFAFFAAQRRGALLDGILLSASIIFSVSLLGAGLSILVSRHRARTRRALETSEARHRAIFENVQDIYYVTDRNGMILEVSPSVERFGYDRAALIGASVLDIYEEPEQHADLVKAILEDGEIGDYEIRLKTGAGEVADASVTAHAHFGPDGRMTRIEGLLRDITERKRMERALLSIVEGTSTTTGAGFFDSLVRHLAAALDVRYAFVAELTDATLQRAKTLAVWAGDSFGDHFEYELAGTPCENVAGKGMCHYPKDVQEIFPQDQLLVDLGAESYLGTPLFDSSGCPLGILAVLDDKPMVEVSNARSMLTVFSARAGAELERKRTEETLRQALETERERARRDSLTGVLNHGAITQVIRERCTAAADGPVAIAMVDVDNLKATNDIYGHQLGDQVLIATAHALARDDAIVGRYGGDEFVAVLPGAGRPAAERYRDAVLTDLRTAPLTDDETGTAVPISTSIGIAIYPEEAETVIELVRLSDSAMYTSRRRRPAPAEGVAGARSLSDERAAQMVGQIVPLLTSPGKLGNKLQLVSHRLSVGAGYDAVDFSLFAPEPGSPLAQNTFAPGPQELVDAWNREQQDDTREPHPIRLLFQRTPRPVIVDDPWNDELLRKAQRDILRKAELRSVLVAPLIWRDRVIGSLGVASRQAGAFGADDAQFVGAVAMQVTAIMQMETLVDELQASAGRLSHAHEETVLLLAAVAEAHDQTAGRHLQSVRRLVEALAGELGASDEDASAMGLASVLHDIGKVHVADAILTSPGKPVGDQWEVMKQHTIWGAEFLAGHEGFELAASIARHHHERWDGSGYPAGLSGGEIPEPALIVAVADAFDAIVHDRPYRAARTIAEAVSEIVEHRDRQFSPDVVGALERLHAKQALPGLILLGPVEDAA